MSVFNSDTLRDSYVVPLMNYLRPHYHYQQSNNNTQYSNNQLSREVGVVFRGLLCANVIPRFRDWLSSNPHPDNLEYPRIYQCLVYILNEINNPTKDETVDQTPKKMLEYVQFILSMCKPIQKLQANLLYRKYDFYNNYNNRDDIGPLVKYYCKFRESLQNNLDKYKVEPDIHSYLDLRVCNSQIPDLSIAFWIELNTRIQNNEKAMDAFNESIDQFS